MRSAEGRIDLPQRSEKNPFSDQRKIEARVAVGRLRMYFDRLRDGESGAEQGREIRKILVEFHPDKPGNAEYKDLAKIAAQLFEANKDPRKWSRQLASIGNELKAMVGGGGVEKDVIRNKVYEVRSWPASGNARSQFEDEEDEGVGERWKEYPIEKINLDSSFVGRKISTVFYHAKQGLLYQILNEGKWKSYGSGVSNLRNFFEVEGVDGVLVGVEKKRGVVGNFDGFRLIKNLKKGYQYGRADELGVITGIERFDEKYPGSKKPGNYVRGQEIRTDKARIRVGEEAENPIHPHGFCDFDWNNN